MLHREIKSPHDLEEFQASDTYTRFLGFILALNDSVKGKQLSYRCHASTAIDSLLHMLDVMAMWTNEIPPKPHRTRFGNEAFCEWYDRLQDNARHLVCEIVPESEFGSRDGGIPYEEAVGELTEYLSNSFGDRTRIDYGSGHEAHFTAFLLLLELLGVLSAEDHTAVVLRVFQTYISLMRRLQEVYWLEPAGSHGVWGLDDYQFLPFLFGSAQLIGHKHIHPKSIRSKEVVGAYAHEYLYLGCIEFICKVKTGSLVEHSPMLLDISGVKTWNKVNEGMIKMYKAELLNKFPVMQHFLFGKLLPFKSCGHEEHSDSHAHSHTHTHTMPTCCISRIPSAFANKSHNPRGVFTGID
jgi:serine/threonine-protein phosphatase 2A activator